MTLEQQLEAVLFYKASALTKIELQKVLSCDGVELEAAAKSLQERLLRTGLRLLISESMYDLVTAPAMDEVIESLRKDEMRRDIGKAGAETLAIILYRGPVTRLEIDRIRGVNSSFILRNLLMRGLVEKISTDKQVRYQGTTELLAQLGITHKTELPEFASIMNVLEKFEAEADS